MQNRRSPLIHSPLEERQTFVEPVECSRSKQGNTKIMEMLVSIKKEMEEREKRWEQQQKIREEFQRLTSEKGNNDGNKCSNKEMRNGKKK